MNDGDFKQLKTSTCKRANCWSDMHCIGKFSVDYRLLNLLCINHGEIRMYIQWSYVYFKLSLSLRDGPLVNPSETD